MQRTLGMLLQCLILVGFGLAQNNSAQRSSDHTVKSSSDSMLIDVGTISNNAYANSCLGFSLPIPTNWAVHSLTANGRAVHMSDSELLLLKLSHQTEPSSDAGLNLWGINLTAGPAREDISVRDAASYLAKTQVAIDRQNRKLLRDAEPVEYGGKMFYRANYEQISKKGATLYLAFIITRFRSYFIDAAIVARSAEELDEFADVLRSIAFQQDVVNPSCTVGPDEYPGKVGVVGSPPKAGTFDPERTRVRVSMSISQALLQTRTDPEYPEDARKAGASGHVVLSIIVDREGKVQEATSLSGDPLLVPAAIAAVKQWKYKPYVLSGQAVAMDTTVKVDFPEQK